MMELLRGRGARFADDSLPTTARTPGPLTAPPPVLAEPTPVAPARVAPPRTVPAPDVMEMPGNSATGLGRPIPAAAVDGDGDELTQMGTPLPPPRPRPVRPILAPPGGGGPPLPPASGRSAPGKKAPAPKAKPRSRLRRWLSAGFAGSATFGLVVAVGCAIGIFGAGWYYSRELPSVETLGAYRPPTVTVVYDQHGELMGEIYEKRRYVVELDAMPQVLLDAFISAEDASFYEHGGIDYMGIVRAVGRNALAGKKAQGASTITQQVARAFLLTNEKTFTRKIKEVLLAWRVEEAFDKKHILYLYLNQIYLGSGAYGVEAAARVYFGKHVADLTLAEAAMIAGLPQRPSDYSPHRHLEKAKARQRYVLDQMTDNGVITKEEGDKAHEAELLIVARKNEFLVKAPWFTEHIRRYLVEKYGQDRVYNDGLVVHSTCDLALQQEAQRAITGGVGDAEEKIGGWRGATEHLEPAAMEERRKVLATKLSAVVEGEFYTGVVTEVQKKHALVDLGGVTGIMPLSWTNWAYPVTPEEPRKGRKIDDMARALSVGDVVTIEVEAQDFRKSEALAKYAEAGAGPFAAVSLFQKPEIQGALWSYRLDDGAVIAMVGGVDFQDTQFNRATQAQRQVGSTFKPIVYAAAIESKKFTTATIVQDAPLVYNTLRNQLWKPANYGEDYLGDITLRKALALSRNVVTVRVLDVIGLDPVVALSRRLGIESHMDVDLSMGLGSASLTIPELGRAYSAFATVGHRVEPHYVDKVTDRDGVVLEQFVAPAEWEQVLDPSVAQIMNWMLIEVASNGTAAKAQKLGLRVAGKTGTTNENRDAWFAGYTPTVLTVVWVGYDTPRTLGAQATGGHTALPIWMQYMARAVPKETDREWKGGGNVAFVGIDEASGRPMSGGRAMPFLPGTVPGGQAAAAGQKTTEDLLTTEW